MLPAQSDVRHFHKGSLPFMLRWAGGGAG